MRHVALVSTLCMVVVTSACSDEESGPNISGIQDLDIVRVEVSPTLDTMFVADTLRPGDHLQMSAAIIGRLGTSTNGKVVWASSKPEVASVSAAGLVTPTGFGTTIISASASSVGKATITVMPAARTVVLTPGSDTIFVEDPIALRDSIKLVAKAFDETGTLIVGQAFTWTSAGATTATVNFSGSVLARGLGVVNITATSGTVAGNASIRVASAVKAIQLASPVPTVLAKDTIQLTATALGYNDKPMGGRTFTWTSSNPTVATVDANGRAAFLRAGSATFTAKSAFTTSTVAVNALERQFQLVSSSAEFTCGFTNLGRGYCWGVGDGGVLASAADSTCFDATDEPLLDGGKHGCTLLPKRFSGPAIEFTAMDAGDASNCAISKDRNIYCWGSDAFGQLGNGSRGGGAAPSLATVAQERFDSVTVGGAHACALNAAGRAYCWGADEKGQLGDNRIVNSTTPIPVAGTLVFTSISAGGRHTCGIAGGQAYCWGDNDQGQLGIGTFGDSRSSPVAVAGGAGMIAISAGSDHTCGLKSTGAAVCWGAGWDGQAGPSADGDIATTPEAVGGPAFARISAGRFHTCAVTAAGAAYCWGGQSQYGGVSSSSAIPVAGGLVMRSISAGHHHTCGIASDGETYCWGSNVFGTLGNELQAAFRTSPEKVAVPR